MAELRQRDNNALIEKHIEGLNKNASLIEPFYHNNSALFFLSPAYLDLIAQHDFLF